MPNALKLQESVDETEKECPDEFYEQILIPVSSGTIAAGVIRGMFDQFPETHFLIHLGYSRSHMEVEEYLCAKSGREGFLFTIIDEKYAYSDEATLPDSQLPPWSCNRFYDLKAYQWWLENRERFKGRTLLWNIG
jgi:hypothetical protein